MPPPLNKRDEKASEGVKENKSEVTSSIKAVSGGATGGALVLGLGLGLLFKFFQVMDNIGSLQNINIEYGAFINQIFDAIDDLQIAPEVDKRALMNSD